MSYKRTDAHQPPKQRHRGMLSKILLTLVSAAFALADGTTAVASGTGCVIAPQATSTMNNGFRVRLYNYPFWDWIPFDDDSWMANSYTGEGFYSTVTGVTMPNFDFNLDIWDWGTKLYGVQIEYNHFLAEYTGYFLAQEDGMHTLSISDVDDGAMVWFGSEMAFNCCGPQLGIPDNSHTDYTFRATNRWGLDSTQVDKGLVFLEKGVYYPLRIVYANVGENAKFAITITTPSGTVLENMDGFVFSSDHLDNGICHEGIASYNFNIMETKTITGATTATTSFQEVTADADGATKVWVEEVVYQTDL